MIFQGKQFLPYAAGNKIYGGGRDAPNIGPVDPTGHQERDLKYQARRTVMLRRLKAMQNGDFANPDVGRQI
jgi:hypothetical protein